MTPFAKTAKLYSVQRIAIIHIILIKRQSSYFCIFNVKIIIREQLTAISLLKIDLAVIR